MKIEDDTIALRHYTQGSTHNRVFIYKSSRVYRNPFLFIGKEKGPKIKSPKQLISW